MEQSIHPPRRQQSMQHSGVREALLAPMAAPALPDEVRSVFPPSRPAKKKSSAPQGAEHPSPTAAAERVALQFSPCHEIIEKSC